MLNLYWKTNEQTRNLTPKPFKTEAEFEKYIFENQDLLGDIFILHRQIRTGSKEGIADMVGVDQDSRICIIEMKNNEVNEDILPQVLGYAMWADTNPDSIRAIWLEAKNRPVDIQVEWDSLEIRIIVIAPAFRQNILKMTRKIGYPIDLVQVQRFSFDAEEFILVETLAEAPYIKPGVTKTMGDWTWEYYEEEHGKDAVQEFHTAVNQLESFVQAQGWGLPYNLNKYYTGFKLGNKVVFDVSWEGAKAWKLKMKIPQELAQKFMGETWEYQRFDAPFKNALFRLKPRKPIDISELKPLLLAAYKNVSGTQEHL